MGATEGEERRNLFCLIRRLLLPYAVFCRYKYK